MKLRRRDHALMDEHIAHAQHAGNEEEPPPPKKKPVAPADSADSATACVARAGSDQRLDVLTTLVVAAVDAARDKASNGGDVRRNRARDVGDRG